MDQILPVTPFNGQEYLDAFRVKWVYSSADEAWNRIGVVSDVPVARPVGDPQGPTNGLLSAADKNLLDKTNPKQGGFGFVLKPGYHLTEDNGVNNILTGDVTLVSESLKFECGVTGVGPSEDEIPVIRIGLSQDFLDSYAYSIKGPPGPAGAKGPKGKPGRPGTGDGPRGDPGKDGVDATVLHKFTGIKYEELDEVYDVAVVNLRLDAPNGVLEVTKAQMDVPDDDKPARRVVASPIIRDVQFISTDMSNWQLIAPVGDPADADLNVIKLPKGWVADDDSPVPIHMVKLSTVVGAIVEYYDNEADKIIAQWDRELNDWIKERDAAARSVLHQKAEQLADCQFQLPLEFCLGIQTADCHPATFLAPNPMASMLSQPSVNIISNSINTECAVDGEYTFVNNGDEASCRWWHWQHYFGSSGELSGVHSLYIIFSNSTNKYYAKLKRKDEETVYGGELSVFDAYIASSMGSSFWKEISISITNGLIGPSGSSFILDGVLTNSCTGGSITILIG